MLAEVTSLLAESEGLEEVNAAGLASALWKDKQQNVLHLFKGLRSKSFYDILRGLVIARKKERADDKKRFRTEEHLKQAEASFRSQFSALVYKESQRLGFPWGSFSVSPEQCLQTADPPLPLYRFLLQPGLRRPTGKRQAPASLARGTPALAALAETKQVDTPARPGGPGWNSEVGAPEAISARPLSAAGSDLAEALWPTPVASRKSRPASRASRMATGLAEIDPDMEISFAVWPEARPDAEGKKSMVPASMETHARLASLEAECTDLRRRLADLGALHSACSAGLAGGAVSDRRGFMLRSQTLQLQRGAAYLSSALGDQAALVDEVEAVVHSFIGCLEHAVAVAVAGGLASGREGSLAPLQLLAVPGDLLRIACDLRDRIRDSKLAAGRARQGSLVVSREEGLLEPGHGGVTVSQSLSGSCDGSCSSSLALSAVGRLETSLATTMARLDSVQQQLLLHATPVMTGGHAAVLACKVREALESVDVCLAECSRLVTVVPALAPTPAGLLARPKEDLGLTDVAVEMRELLSQLPAFASNRDRGARVVAAISRKTANLASESLRTIRSLRCQLRCSEELWYLQEEMAATLLHGLESLNREVSSRALHAALQPLPDIFAAHDAYLETVRTWEGVPGRVAGDPETLQRFLEAWASGEKALRQAVTAVDSVRVERRRKLDALTKNYLAHLSQAKEKLTESANIGL